ncbi:MAG: trehalose-phosphatase [Dehalococcoidia bacterium]
MQESALAAPDETFYRSLETARARVLMLDYDGTLAPFREVRTEAVPYAGVREALLSILQGGGTKVVVVSGRALSDLVPLLGIVPLPEIWAAHGWERRTQDGREELFPLSEAARGGLADAIGAAQRAGLETHCEVKPASVALHWRGLSPVEAEAARGKGAALWGAIAAASGLYLVDFDGGMELRVLGRDKGTAVRAILAESPPGAVAAYLGDDVTDEDAFRALPPNGLGVLVRAQSRLVGTTAARTWLRPPGELLAFLHRWAALTGAGP